MQRVIAALPILSLLWSTPGLAQPDRGVDYWHPAWGWGHMMFGGLMMIVFWGGIVVVIVLLVRWLGGTSPSGHGAPPFRRRPLEILQERFAKGEIDKEEYEERRKLLAD